MDEEGWYNQLEKPTWAPDESVFGQVWTVLYVIIAAVNIYVLFLLTRGRITWKTALPFWLNLFFNALFTPLQFGLKSNFLAAFDIVLVLITTAWAMAAIWKYAKWPAVAFVPYLVWISIATVLQFSILIKN